MKKKILLIEFIMLYATIAFVRSGYKCQLKNVQF